MKMTKADLAQLYTILDEQTPLTSDCGSLCGAACCREDEEDGTLCGVYLLDIEAEELSNVGWAHVVTDESSNRQMLMCDSMCDRSKRPWLCRIFPLCPIDDGKRVRIDARSRAVCPLVRSGLKGFSADFKKAVARSAVFLAGFEDGADFIREWEASESKFREPLW